MCLLYVTCMMLVFAVAIIILFETTWVFIRLYLWWLECTSKTPILLGFLMPPHSEMSVILFVMGLQSIVIGCLLILTLECCLEDYILQFDKRPCQSYYHKEPFILPIYKTTSFACRKLHRNCLFVILFLQIVEWVVGMFEYCSSQSMTIVISSNSFYFYRSWKSQSFKGWSTPGQYQGQGEEWAEEWAEN